MVVAGNLRCLRCVTAGQDFVTMQANNRGVSMVRFPRSRLGAILKMEDRRICFLGHHPSKPLVQPDLDG